MHFHDIKTERLKDILRRKFMIAEDESAPSIPSESELNRMVQDDLTIRGDDEHGPLFKQSYVLHGVSNDLPAMQKALTDAALDLAILYDEFNAQIRAASDEMVVSRNENARYSRRLSALKRDLENLRLFGLNVIHEDFDSLTQSDLQESVGITFDTSGSLIRPMSFDEAVADLSHYSINGPTFTLTSGSEFVISQTTPAGMATNALFDGSVSTQWLVDIQSNGPAIFRGEMIVQASPVGALFPLSEVAILTDTPDMIVGIQYMNSRVDWTDLPTPSNWKRLTGGSPTWKVTEGALLGGGVTHLKFTFEVDRECTPRRYRIAANEMRLVSRRYSGRGTFVSRPLSFYDNITTKLPINYLNLDWVSDGDSTFYCAVDQPISGTWIDLNGNVTTSSSPFLDHFDPSGQGTVYATDLRDHSLFDGATSYSDWEPNWVRVEKAFTTQLVGNSSYTDMQDFLSRDIPQPDYERNGINFYRLYQFDRPPKTVSLRYGRDTWIRTSHPFVELRTTSSDGGGDYVIGVDVEGAVTTLTYDVNRHGGVESDSDVAINFDSIQKLNLYDGAGDNLYFFTRGTATNQFQVSEIYTGGVLQKNKVRLILGSDIPTNPLGHYNGAPYSFEYSYSVTGTANTWRTFVLTEETRNYFLNYINPILTEYEGSNTPAMLQLSVTRVDTLEERKVVPGSAGRIQLFPGWNLISLTTRVQNPLLDADTTITPSLVNFTVLDGQAELPTNPVMYLDYQLLTDVARYQLMSNTHRDNHSTFSVEKGTDNKYYVIVNEPGTPSGFVSVIDQVGVNKDRVDNFYNRRGVRIRRDLYEEADGYIFATPSGMASFYSIGYELPGPVSENFLVKCDLNQADARVHSYTISLRDGLDSTVVTRFGNLSSDLEV